VCTPIRRGAVLNPLWRKPAKKSPRRSPAGAKLNEVRPANGFLLPDARAKSSKIVAKKKPRSEPGGTGVRGRGGRGQRWLACEQEHHCQSPLYLGPGSVRSRHKCAQHHGYASPSGPTIAALAGRAPRHVGCPNHSRGMLMVSTDLARRS